MRYGSVCSGIEAATVAWEPLGWDPAWFAEIEPFPSAVLAHHYPEVPNLGDFTAINPAPGSIDLLVGGTPCQSFSVAGLRGGMADDRGNLALEFLRLAGRARPRWVVWENVLGVLSSNGGRDFGAFLGGLAELGYGFAYRVLDAQHFGVPQRRRRVFVVGHLGDWRRAVAVLFERHSLSGHPAPRRQADAGVASGAQAGTPFKLTRGGPGHRGITAMEDCVSPTMDCDSSNPIRNQGGLLVAHSLRADGFHASEDGTGRGTPLVPVAFHATQDPINGEVCPCLPTQKGTCGVAYIVNAAESCAVQSHARPSETARCLDSTGSFANAQGGTVVAFNWQAGGSKDFLGPVKERSPALARKQTPAFVQGMAVRRLTPRECERLQGFPDDWTLVPYRGKPASDGPRYKAIGNSFAVPVVRWIGERIALVDQQQPQAR